MSPTTRDPIHDPRPGDVLWDTDDSDDPVWCVWLVTARDGGTVVYDSIAMDGTRDDGRPYDVAGFSIAFRDATVLRVAERAA